MKTRSLTILNGVLPFISPIAAQEINVTYLNPAFITAEYDYIRFGNSSSYYTGFMYNKVYPAYGDGNDFTLFTYDNRDIVINSNAGKLILSTHDDSKVGIGTKTPRTKLQVMGASETQSSYITNYANLSSSDLVTTNNYKSFSGAAYIDGSGASIGRYFIYRSAHGGYLNFNGQGFGFYSQGHYPRMFFEVISANHGEYSNLPSDSPIKNGYIYQQIKGPLANAMSTPIKAISGNSQWLWGVSSAGNLVVAGEVESREVKVSVDAGADYVFESDYKLTSLEDLSGYIREHKHLPEIPAAAELESEGIELSK